jgi:hypothetical protein
MRNVEHSEMDPEGCKELENEEVPDHIFREQVREKIRKQRKGSRQGIRGDRPK